MAVAYRRRRVNRMVERTPFRALPTPARRFVAAAIAFGGVAIGARFAAAEMPATREQWILLVLATILGSRSVRIGRNIELTPTLPLTFLAFIRCGWGTAMDVAVVAMLATCLMRRSPLDLYKTAFNAGAIALATGAGAAAFGLGARAPADSRLERLVWSVFAGAAAYFLVNTLLVAAAAGTARSLPILSIWREQLLGTVTTSYAGASLAIAAAFLIEWSGGAAVLLVLPGIWVLLQCYRLQSERNAERLRRIEVEAMNDARRHAASAPSPAEGERAAPLHAVAAR